MRFLIRSAGPTDAEAFAAVGVATFALACPPSTPAAALDAYIRTELSPDKFLAHLNNARLSLMAAELDQRVVGYLMLRRDPSPPPVQALRPLEVNKLYVLSECHGTGVGQALMGAALEQARHGGHDALWLSVSQHNGRGLSFYRKLGFRVVGEQTFQVGGDTQEDFIMARSVGA